MTSMVMIIIRLTHSIIFADQLKAKNQGDKVGEIMIYLDWEMESPSKNWRG